MLFGLLLLPVLMFGCSDDDDDVVDPPQGPDRVVAFHASSAPSLTDVDDALWGSATATDVDVESTPLAPGIPREVHVAFEMVAETLVDATLQDVYNNFHGTNIAVPSLEAPGGGPAQLEIDCFIDESSLPAEFGGVGV